MSSEVHTLTSAMARIQRLATLGFTYHTGGVLPLPRALHVVAKFQALYGIEERNHEARRRREHGEARTRITLWPQDGALRFVLQATEGRGAVHEQERLQDARERRQRLRIRDYELLVMPRRGDPPGWTWRIVPEEFALILEHGCSLAGRQHGGAAQDWLRAQLNRPGFHGVREQLTALVRAMRRRRPELQTPSVLPWIRGTFRKCEPLESWLANEERIRAFGHVPA